MNLRELAENWETEESFERAAQKFGDLTDQSHHRYLALLCSAGIACGASSIEVYRDASWLVVKMPGAYFHERDLDRGLAMLFAPRRIPVCDLVLGLLLSRAMGSQSATVHARHPEQPSYQWQLDSAESEYQEKGEALLKVVVGFEASWLEQAVDWLQSFTTPEKSEECIWLQQLSQHAQTPISIEGTPINKPWLIEGSPIALVRGQPCQLEPDKCELVCEAKLDWEGVLALGPGRLRFVVNGLLYPGPEDLRLDGLVVHNQLSVDPCRESVEVPPELREEFLNLRQRLVPKVDLTRVPPGWLYPMLDLYLESALEGQLSDPAMDCLVNSLEEIPEGDRPHEDLPELQFLHRRCQHYRENGQNERLQVAAQKGYQRARLAFDDAGLSLELIDICAELCLDLDYLRSASTDWRLLGTAVALRKLRDSSQERLERLLELSPGRHRSALLHLGLWAYHSSQKQRREAHHHRETLQELLPTLTRRFEAEEMQTLLREDPEVVCAMVASKLQHLAAYNEEVDRALNP